MLLIVPRLAARCIIIIVIAIVIINYYYLLYLFIKYTNMYHFIV